MQWKDARSGKTRRRKACCTLRAMAPISNISLIRHMTIDDSAISGVVAMRGSTRARPVLNPQLMDGRDISHDRHDRKSGTSARPLHLSMPWQSRRLAQAGYASRRRDLSGQETIALCGN